MRSIFSSCVASGRANPPDEPIETRLVGDDSPYRLRNVAAICVVVIFSLVLAGCVAPPPPPAPVVENPPPAPREFRGVWVATVANIDWPSKPGLPVEQQRAELIAILDRARSLKLNAVILQVRPAADALYPSELEPWSEYLSGAQGRAPEPFYDPLALWIEEAHRRGLELHAWFNPYRARHHEAKSAFAPTHLAKTHPDSVKKYGELWWIDPGDAFAARRTLDVVADVVRRYDVDGVHLDDYFYPYPIAVPAPAGLPAKPGAAKQFVDFPDETSWQLYRTGGGKLDRADWRRENVNHLVEKLYRTVHELKPWVQFGVSPFGIGRPDRRPAGINGFSQYDKLYADVELWLRNGWVDYLVPQLYWPIKQKEQAFGPLLDYWISQNSAQRHLWPGLFASAINDTPKSWVPAEITQQIELTRLRPAASGHVLFSMAALIQDRRGLAGKLSAGLYSAATLVPATPWLDGTLPPAPQARRESGGRILLVPGSGKATANFSVWRRSGLVWDFSVQPAAEPEIEVRGANAIVVAAVDRLGNESPRVTLPLVSSKKP